MSSPILKRPPSEWNDEFVVSEELIGRLHRASESAVLEIVAPLSLAQRANLAAHCYRRAHLHAIGLTIASLCDQLTLVQMLGTAQGTVLYLQSRERNAEAAKTATSARSKVSLATFTGQAPIVPDADPDDLEVLAEDEDPSIVPDIVAALEETVT
jgi:hypothetical protein